MINLSREYYGALAVDYARQLIQERRIAVRLDHSKEEYGSRFYSDDFVMVTLESMSPEHVFEADPTGTVDAALHEAAAGDYWYENKSWDMDGDGDWSEGDEDDDY